VSRQLGQKKTVKIVAINKLIATNFGRLVQIPFSGCISFFSRVIGIAWKINKNKQIPSKVIDERICLEI
jgi:hypothetical protein